MNLFSIYIDGNYRINKTPFSTKVNYECISLGDDVSFIDNSLSMNVMLKYFKCHSHTLKDIYFACPDSLKSLDLDSCHSLDTIKTPNNGNILRSSHYSDGDTFYHSTNANGLCTLKYASLCDTKIKRFKTLSKQNNYEFHLNIGSKNNMSYKSFDYKNWNKNTIFEV
jgi:hypothetical protein